MRGASTRCWAPAAGWGCTPSCTWSWAPPTPELTDINVTHPEADKGTALAVAARHLGVPMEAAATVGDGFNDLPLLRAAGTAIAMGQAPQELRAAAHLVVPEVADDGVAHALGALAGWSRARARAGATGSRMRSITCSARPRA